MKNYPFFIFPGDHSSRQEKEDTLGLILIMAFNYDFIILWPPQMFFYL